MYFFSSSYDYNVIKNSMIIKNIKLPSNGLWITQFKCTKFHGLGKVHRTGGRVTL